MTNTNVADLSIDEMYMIIAGQTRNTTQQDAAIVAGATALHDEASLWAAGRFSDGVVDTGFDEMTKVFTYYLVAELAKLGWKVPSNG